jgi:hypothetical protein
MWASSQRIDGADFAFGTGRPRSSYDSITAFASVTACR